MYTLTNKGYNKDSDLARDLYKLKNNVNQECSIVTREWSYGSYFTVISSPG
jgi:hypothetical protein